MTDKGLKELKDTLWHSADVLRASAHLAANKYGQPILGLIFLRYADILYKQHKEEIEAEYAKLAEESHLDVEKVKSSFAGDDSYIKNRVVADKTIDFLKSNAVYVDSVETKEEK